MLKLSLQPFAHLMRRTDSFEKTLVLGNTEGRRRRGKTEDEMDGIINSMDINLNMNGRTPGDSEGQGSLSFFSPWGSKESYTTEWLSNNNNNNQLNENGLSRMCSL